MKNLKDYIKFSGIFHVAVLVVFIIVTAIWSEGVKKRVTLVIIPKGTSPDAVLTQSVLDRMNNENTDTPDTTMAPIKTETPIVTPPPTARPTAQADTPKPTPTPSPTPRNTPVLTPVVKKTPTPSPTPDKNKPTPTPATPTKKAEPTKKATPTAKPTLRPTKSPTPEPTRRITTAYDLEDSAIPSAMKTPAGAQVQERLLPGQRAGVPGLPNGVEGAPMPLDPSIMQGAARVTAEWAASVRLKIQSNFTMPPNVTAAGLKCEVEWEVLPDGTIQNARVRKSTGVAVLDTCALNALHKTVKVEKLPTEWNSQSVWTSLVFEFGN